MRAIVFNARVKVGIHIYLLCLSGLQHFRWHIQKEEHKRARGIFYYQIKLPKYLHKY